MNLPATGEALKQMIVDLASQKEDLKAKLKEVDERLQVVLKSVGEGETFQAEDGTVYRVIVPKGTFISFPEIGYERTRKEGEKGGNYLAKKEAEALGFKLA
jgi:small nuclear ribonucleoprotein (snRNP)-like protein